MARMVSFEHALADLDAAELETVGETFSALVPWSLERDAPRRAVLYGALAESCAAEQKRRSRVLSEWAADLADDGDAGEIVDDAASPSRCHARPRPAPTQRSIDFRSTSEPICGQTCSWRCRPTSSS